MPASAAGSGGVRPERARILDAVGFNPFRQQRRSFADYAMVGGALIVLVLLVLWAFFG